jgi:hypothetical protein
MEISIGSYKFRLEILVAIVIVSWIMFGHILCSCCRVNLLETMVNIKGEITNGSMGKKAVAKEGFTGSNKTNTGPEFSGADSPGYIMNPSKWSMPTLTYSPGTKPDAGVQSIWDRPKQPVPLPEGQLDLFASTPFKPECCPNAYSNSMGCACMTTEQYNYLKNRGSNNVPYSEY